jgi:hypothetical protein
MSGHPIHVVGDRPRGGYFYLCDELVRNGIRELGSDGFTALAYLVSRAGTANGKPFQTSPTRMSEDFGWGSNRERARAALAAVEKAHRMVRRPLVRDGKELKTRWDYMIAVGGRRLTDWELTEYSKATVLPSKADPRDNW